MQICTDSIESSMEILHIFQKMHAKWLSYSILRSTKNTNNQFQEISVYIFIAVLLLTSN